MAYNNDAQNTDDATKKELFKFGNYVSPNPKPISLGVKLKPDPVIKIKTESKTVKQQPVITPNENTEDENQANLDTKQAPTNIAPTPLKEKVTKQQNEIDCLKAQLLKLQLENERLKSQSASPSNSNSVTPRDSNDKHIAFNPSVVLIDDPNNDELQTDTKLTDKVSIMRSNRDSTPYKPKHVTIQTAKQANKATLDESLGHHRSRGQYRITPIPQKKTQRIAFKSKLSSINDKENIDIFDETPQNIGKLKIIQTPSESEPNDDNTVTKHTEMVTPNISFNLGQAPLSGTPSFLMASRESSLRPEATPDFMNNPQNLTLTGNGASNLVSPILTPMRGQDTSTKPFSFAWNRKK